MSTDRLIERLADDLRPVRPRRPGNDALKLAMLGAIELVLFLSLGAARADLPVAAGLASFWWKLASLGIVTLVAGTVTILSLDPARSPRAGLRWVAGIVAVCLAAGWIIGAAPAGSPAIAARLDWPDGMRCVAEMALLSVPAVIGLGLLMRRGAATDIGGTALAAGTAAASWGAFVFALACPHDDPLYIAVWYAVGCGLVTASARLALPLLSRW